MYEQEKSPTFTESQLCVVDLCVVDFGALKLLKPYLITTHVWIS